MLIRLTIRSLKMPIKTNEEASEYFKARKAKWWSWHKKNPQVYELFEQFSLQAIKKGHKRLSAWLIINRVRWETSVETYGDPFKISNDYIAFYSRYFMHRYPQHKGFFKLHAMIGENNE